ncbi:MAG: CoA transferase [Actinomycetota bacterium]|nr:CoA transferase [Actinomycetota bacterium]
MQPLAGLRVIDLTVSLAGPYCTQLLGALGVDVVKVERPDVGDDTRAWGPPFWDGESVLFLAANANKRSLALDFTRPEGREALLRLVDDADVFVQSLRPGRAEHHGLGYDDLQGRNPRLVYCSIGAFGREGPLRQQPGYDPLMQAAGGIMSVTGEPGREPVRVGASVVDQGTALWAAIGILLGLAERERTGHGRNVDVSLYETAVSLVPYQIGGYLASGELPGRHGSAFPLIAPYEAFETSDGSLMIAAANDRLYGALCNAIELPELAADPRFATNPERVANRNELIPLLAERLRTDTTSAWLEQLAQAGVPAAPVQSVAEVAEHEQTRALGLLQQLGAFTVVAQPLSLDRQRVTHRTEPPQLGEHTAEILAEAGYDEAELAELVRSGVVRLGNGPAR